MCKLIDVSKILKLYNEGIHISEIAKEFGVCPATIYRYARKAGYKLRIKNKGPFICSCCNKEFVSARKLSDHIYWFKNRLKINAQTKIYDSLHIKERQKYLEKYILEHKEDYSRRQREFLATSRGRMLKRMWKQNRDRILEGSSKLTISKIEEVYRRQTNQKGELVCCLCSEVIKKGEDSLEHKIPICRAKEFPGVDLNSLENLGVAHSQFSKEACNSKKKHLTLEEYLVKTSK